MVPEKPRDQYTGGLSHRKRPRPHHISAIAHHFLEPSEKDLTTEGATPQGLAVAGSGHGLVIAWVCAGLIRGMRSRPVHLMESTRLHWSATSHLQDLAPVIQNKAEDSADSGNEDSGFWSILPAARPSSPGARQHSRSLRNAVAFPVQNLGNLNNHQLGLLEASLLVPGSVGMRMVPHSTLVWCLGPSEAGSLASFYTLNRALKLLTPSRLELIIVDQGSLSSSRSELTALDPRDVDRCREAMASIQGLGEVGCTHLSSSVTGSPSSPSSPSKQLAHLGQRFCGAVDSD